MRKDLIYKSSQYNTAIENKWRIAVYQQDEILDEGVIESQTLESVKINGSYFIKSNCQFVIVGDERIEGDIADLNKIVASKANSPELLAFIEDGELFNLEELQFVVLWENGLVKSWEICDYITFVTTIKRIMKTAKLENIHVFVTKSEFSR